MTTRPEGPADRIVLKGIGALGRHGVLGFEQERAQPFEVDVELEMDLSAPAATDDLTRTADYGRVVGAVVAVVETQSFRLLEALADSLARRTLEVSGAEAVTVEVRKVRPPVPYQVVSAGVRIRRERADRPPDERPDERADRPPDVRPDHPGDAR